MSIFLITPLAHNGEALAGAIASTFPAKDFFTLMNDAGWFVDFHGTSIELSARIGITAGGSDKPRLGSALVTPITSYYGRGPADMWEWLKTRFESQ